MTAPTGLVFDVQGFCLHDGPGTRTTLFLKGCPLRCRWCCNPEGISPEPEIRWREERCAGTSCRLCLRACPVGAITLSADQATLCIDRDRCRTCARPICAEACPTEALRWCGRHLDLPRLARILTRDRRFWSPDGGVTFSGGEPLAQPQFLAAALDWCRAEGIHAAVETSGCAPREVFLDILRRVPFAFVDLKNPDPDDHRAHTGVDPTPILANLAALAATAWPGRLVIRIPLAAGRNDTDRHLALTAAIVRSLGLQEINLLPLHRLGAGKWPQTGLPAPADDWLPPPPERIEQARRFLTDQGFSCWIGPETPF